MFCSLKSTSIVAAIVVVACGDSDASSPNGSTPEDGDAALSNLEIVTKVLVDGVAGGDTNLINERVREDYVQHGSLAPDGRAGLLAFAVLSEKIRAEVHRTLVDGDRVALHSTLTFPDGTQSVAFDVFRLEGGQLAEHWDAVQPLSGPNPSGRTMTDGETRVTDLDATEENRSLASDFVDVVLAQGHWDRAPEFVSADYAQHNPSIADGMEGLSAFAMSLENQGFASLVTASPIVVAQGNFVLIGSEGTSGPVSDPKYAIFYDLFRVSEGSLVEHWDVVPVMPVATALPHDNGFF